MGLYPSLDGSSPKPASKFTTVKDKVLMEMNERARKQLEAARAAPANANPFSLGQPSAPKQRFASAHRKQFAKMESVESHPSVKARRSQEESAAKRRRAIDKTIRIENEPKARVGQKTMVKVQAPAPVPAKTPAPAPAPAKTLSQPKPIAKLGRPSITPRQPHKPRNTNPREPTPGPTISTVARPTKPSASTHASTPTPTPLLSLPSAPTHIPSYARPTQATMKREVARTRPPARIKQLLDTLPSAPKRGAPR